MDIDNTVVQTLIALFPGVIASLVYSRLKATKHTQLWVAFVEIFVFAFLSYAVSTPVVDLIWKGSPAATGKTDVILSNAVIVQDWRDFYAASVVALVLSVVAAISHNHKWLSRIARAIRITSSYGDEDVWQYMHNSPDVEWVFVRDPSENVVYYGKINLYSDPYKPRELMLTDVEVYPNETSEGVASEPIQKLDAVYLSRPTDGWTIEIPELSGTLPSTISSRTAEKLIGNSKHRIRRVFRNLYSRSHEEDAWLIRRKPTARQKRILRRALTHTTEPGIIESEA